MNTKIWAFLLMLFSIVGMDGVVAQEHFPEVEIGGTQLREITSSIVEGQQYKLFISLPREYKDATKRFPVIYVLDAQWDFTLLYSIYGEQYYDGFIPGCIIVGVTWGGDRPNYDSLRVRDLSPTHTSNIIQSGGAPKFLSFLKGELIPYVDSTFRTKTHDRILMGSSFGGLFTLYAMFNTPEVFNRFVLTSPYLAYDNNVIFTFENKFADKNTWLNAKLYLAQGEHEGGISLYKKFVNQLQSRNYRGLEIQSKILEHVGHSGTKAIGYTRGLQFIFSRNSIKLPDKILNEYIGYYELSDNVIVKVAKKNGRLMVQLPSYNEELELHVESENDFYVEGTYLNVHIRKDEAGKVIGAQIDQFNGETFSRKVK